MENFPQRFNVKLSEYLVFLLSGAVFVSVVCAIYILAADAISPPLPTAFVANGSTALAPS